MKISITVEVNLNNKQKATFQNKPMNHFYIGTQQSKKLIS